MDNFKSESSIPFEVLFYIYLGFYIVISLLGTFYVLANYSVQNGRTNWKDRLKAVSIVILAALFWPIFLLAGVMFVVCL